MNIQSSFTVYTAALHALILNPLLLAYFWLGLSWIDSIDSISANKRFSSSKTSSRKPYSNSKQQEKQKQSAENTIHFCFCVCRVLGLLAPVHRCARSVCCFACAVSWASWLVFTCVPARCVVLRVRCPGPPGSCSPVCPLGVLFRVCGVLGLLAPVHRCACSVCCVGCAVSWASWLLFTGVPARCVVLCVRCPGPPGSCSPVCPLGVLFRVCGVPGHLVPVHRCARSVCCVACAVSWATWLLFTVVPARCVVSRMRCPGPLGSCSPVCSLCVLSFGLRVVCCCAGRRCGALTRPSGRRLFVAGRGWVPSGRALVHPDGGCS